MDDDLAYRRGRFAGFLLLFAGLTWGGFMGGWVLRGEREAGRVAACEAAKTTAEREAAAKVAEAASCAATVEQAFKQAREVAAGAARCRESLSRVVGERIAP